MEFILIYILITCILALKKKHSILPSGQVGFTLHQFAKCIVAYYIFQILSMD